MKSVVHSRMWIALLSSSLFFLVGCDKLEHAAGIAPDVHLSHVEVTPHLSDDNECKVDLTNNGETGFVTFNFSDNSGYNHLYKSHVDKTDALQTITFTLPGQSILKGDHYKVEIVSESLEQ